MVLDSLKGVAVPKSVRLMWQSTISMGKNFSVDSTSQHFVVAVIKNGTPLAYRLVLSTELTLAC